MNLFTLLEKKKLQAETLGRNTSLAAIAERLGVPLEKVEKVEKMEIRMQGKVPLEDADPKAMTTHGRRPHRDAEASCGDPALVAAYATCAKSSTESNYKTNGGTWQTVGLSRIEICLCRTGQQGCGCQRSTQCTGLCTTTDAPHRDEDCRTAPKGTCAPIMPMVGCRCVFDSNGTPAQLCID